jgi:hypothetical protein
MQIQKLSRAELEGIAREQYQRRYAAAPPKVRNAEAFGALGEHRALRWRGHAYRVPPLSWLDGKRLFVVLQALRGSVAERERARRAGIMVLRRLVGARFRRPFAGATADELRGILEYLLHVADETPASGDAPADIDLIDGLYEFCRAYPALVVGGYPVTWAHYEHGMRHLARAMARDTLRAAEAARVAQATKDGWQEWTRAMRPAAGWL